MQSNTATSENQPAVSLDILAEVRQYKTEPFTVRDGRYVGHDGFVVPRDFGEFYKRFPRYIRNWVKKHADRFAQPEDLEDWAQDLTIHLMNLPATSKHRKAGKEDIVETFDASRHYGASQPRFQNYINLCLTNKFRTMHSARLKEPLCRVGNLSLYGQTDAESGEAGDEYCHSRSEHLRKASGRLEQQRQDRCSIAEFADFLRRKDSGVLPAVEAILAAGTHADAAGFLGITEGRFARIRTRLRQLGRCFESGEPVRRRKPYKKRAKTGVARGIGGGNSSASEWNPERPLLRPH